MQNQYDYLVIGGGSGGIASARRAAEYGARVLVIEKSRLGGTCVNVGCVPKKVMWYAANTAEQLAHADDYGFDVNNVEFNFSTLKSRRDAYISRLNGIYANLLTNSKVDRLEGEAKFIDNKTVEVNGELYTSEQILVATGSRPFVPASIPGAELGETSDDFFEWQTLPESAVIVGAGYIAVELAGVLAALGVNVSLLVRKKRLLKEFDDILADKLAEMMALQNIDLRFETEIDQITKSQKLNIRLRNGEAIVADSLIWATGRTPNVTSLGLENTDIVLDQGAIKVDANQRTSVEQVYAVGDVIGYGMLTPVAIAAGRRLADHLFGNKAFKPLNYHGIPTVVFSHPPMATVGYTEAEAKAEFDTIKIYNSSFKPMSYALAERDVPRTHMKLIVAGPDEKVVGCHMIGSDVDEIIQGFAIPVRMQLPKQEWDETIAIHPTSAEELVTLR